MHRLVICLAAVSLTAAACSSSSEEQAGPSDRDVRRFCRDGAALVEAVAEDPASDEAADAFAELDGDVADQLDVTLRDVDPERNDDPADIAEVFVDAGCDADDFETTLDPPPVDTTPDDTTPDDTTPPVDTTPDDTISPVDTAPEDTTAPADAQFEPVAVPAAALDSETAEILGEVNLIDGDDPTAAFARLGFDTLNSVFAYPDGAYLMHASSGYYSTVEFETVVPWDEAASYGATFLAGPGDKGAILDAMTAGIDAAAADAGPFERAPVEEGGEEIPFAIQMIGPATQFIVSVGDDITFAGAVSITVSAFYDPSQPRAVPAIGAALIDEKTAALLAVAPRPKYWDASVGVYSADTKAHYVELRYDESALGLIDAMSVCEAPMLVTENDPSSARCTDQSGSAEVTFVADGGTLYARVGLVS
jgi:hypothetical protein